MCGESMNQIRIPLSGSDIDDSDRREVNDVLASGRLSIGPKVLAFEEAFAAYLGVKHAVACNSGTSALHMMMVAEGIGPGDEVITSPFSFIASANCIEMVGAKPVFVDIDRKTLNLDARAVEAAITPRTKAVLAVHIFGLSADMPALMAIASQRSLLLLEDACESLGAKANGSKVGAGGLARSAAWGFYPNKQMTTGEGGMVTTNDEGLALSFRRLRNQGRNPAAAWLEHDVLGYNYRLDEMSAALGLSQIRRFDALKRKRDAVAARYAERLRPLKDALSTLAEIPGYERSWFVYTVVLEPAWSRDRLVERLAEKGIQTGKYFAPPIHLQKFYTQKYGYRPGAFPITEDISRRIIALPFHSNLPAAAVDEVCSAIGHLLRSEPDTLRA